jgi:hypothetical protein
VSEGSLGCPISGSIGSKYSLAFIPNNKFRNDFLKEDIEAETKHRRVEIEIAFGERVVSSGVAGPNHVGEIGGGDTVFGVAEIVGVWRVGPDVAAIGLGGIADVARRTTPGCVTAGILGRYGDRVGG